MLTHDELGITPAYAGKRLFTAFASHVFKDHPRLRGEKSFVSRPVIETAGSPPLTRGKEPNLRGRLPQAGITPAYAGKSCSVAFLT